MDTRVTLKPYARFGLTGEKFRELVKIHLEHNDTEPQIRSSNDNPMYDWEAEKIRLVLEHFKHDEILCSIICAMLQLVQDDVVRRRAEAAAVLIPKPERANTVGMFFAPPEEKVTA